MTLFTSALTVISDDQLCQQSRAGDREAFGRIVERYQSLICSLAYSACGNLSRSEDLAQETFVTAWQKLGELRETSKLRAWLCGIVRNLASNAARREQRRGGPAESLELLDEQAAPEADPAAHAVTHEEETLLWSSLAGLPENYREPMVLFYRQGQSVAEVAKSLELSEDAIRQRLSRGRTLLRDEMAKLVETTLTRTRPTAAFTVAVLVALPMASASTAAAAIATGTLTGGGAGIAGKSMLAKLGLGAFAGPLIGLTCAYLGTKAAASTARSKQERDCILRYARYGIIVFCLVMVLGLVATLSQAGKLYTASAPWLILGVSLWTAALVGGIMWMCQRMDAEVQRIRIATNTTDEPYAQVLADQGKHLRLPKFFESEVGFLGLPLFAMTWGGQSADQYKARTVCAWIAIGDIAVSPFLAFGGLAIAPIAIGGITAGIVSLSLWGVAFGAFALGSLAFGWWALGFASVGVKCAVGIAAVARDYAVGITTSATEAGTAVAKEWVRTEWLPNLSHVLVHQLHWWVLGCIAFALVLRAFRNRNLWK